MDADKKKEWKNIPTRRKRRTAVVGLLQLVLTGVALWDLTHRPASQVKGKKLVWGLLTFVQPFGPVSYLLFGRKRS